METAIMGGWFIRNIRAYSDRLKYGRDTADTNIDILTVSPTDASEGWTSFANETLSRLCFTTRVHVLNHNVDEDSHVASDHCALLNTILVLAVKADTLVIRGFRFTFNYPGHISQTLAVISLCNVHFPRGIDVLSLLSQISSLKSAFLHYVTCYSEYPTGLQLPSTLSEVMLTSDHATPALQYADVRLQDHFLRWAVANPLLIPNLCTFAMWEVEDCTTDILLEFIEHLTARDIFPNDTHITIRSGNDYAKDRILKANALRRFLGCTEHGKVEMESDVDHNLPELSRARLSFSSGI